MKLLAPYFMCTVTSVSLIPVQQSQFYKLALPIIMHIQLLPINVKPQILF